MKSQLIAIVAAVLVVGCGQSDHQHSHDDGHSHAEGDHDHVERDGHDHDKELKAAEPVVEASQPEPPTAKAPDISIHDAVEKGNIEAVKQHIAAGTDVNAKGGVIGGTPLHGAVTFGHKEIVELLIAEGADVNAKVEVGDYKGQTPLDLATTFRDRRTETAALLRTHGGKHGTIHSAVDGGDAEAVKEFLAAGADVNAKDGAGRTPLDWAHRGYLRDSPEVKAGKKETANLLRKHGGKTAEELKVESK